jgi:ferritin-like metal-binding protein YciE
MTSEVRELLTEELKDAYSAEKQALRCMQQAVRKASAGALREGIQLHIEQTQVQIERVEQAMEKTGVRPGRKVCEAMRGLVEEAQHEIESRMRKARSSTSSLSRACSASNIMKSPPTARMSRSR